LTDDFANHEAGFRIASIDLQNSGYFSIWNKTLKQMVKLPVGCQHRRIHPQCAVCQLYQDHSDQFPKFKTLAGKELEDQIATDCLVRDRKIRLHTDPVNGKARYTDLQPKEGGLCNGLDRR
jgi:hypothetical protein